MSQLPQPISFTPANPIVYQGNLATVLINNPTTGLEYQWKPYNRKYLDDSYVQHYGTSFSTILYEPATFIVNGVDPNTWDIIETSNITITTIEKPGEQLDTDILPYKLYDLIISRNTKGLRTALLKDKILSQKIIKFYYNQILTAYRFEWNNKNGAPYKIPWLTYQNVINTPNSQPYLLTFKNQWKIFQYTNQNQTRNNTTRSNFAYLLNIVNGLYLENPQKVYYIQS
jgi:hypothetical protein